MYKGETALAAVGAQPLNNTLSNLAHCLLGRFEDPMLHHQCVKLLLVIRNARRQWSNMPVEVPVALLAAKRQ